MKILVLDDEEGILVALKSMLELRGHDVDCAERAQDAVDLVRKNHYDFVFVDYKMPDNDGLWFMKNANLPRNTKALLVTAFVNRQVINRMFSLGASGYLIKPFDEEEVLRNIEFHTSR